MLMVPIRLSTNHSSSASPPGDEYSRRALPRNPRGSVLPIPLAQELQAATDPAVRLDVLIKDLGIRLGSGQGDRPASQDLVAFRKPLAQLPGQLLV